MTELDFIETSPINYGGGNNVNLLISSSVTNPGVDNTPLPPFTLFGLTIPLQDENGLNLSSALKEVTELRFTFTEGTVTTKVLNRTRRGGYFYVRLEPIVFNTLPPTVDTLGVGTPAEQDIFRYDSSEFIFEPFFQISFANNDFNPLMNSTNANKVNAKAGTIHARYEGSKLTSGSVEGNDPALSFREFDGSIHLSDSDNVTIIGIDDNKREIKTIYFNPILTGSHPNKHVQNFPELKSILYEEEDNRFVRISNKKVFIVEKGTVLTMGETGKVTLVQ